MQTTSNDPRATTQTGSGQSTSGQSSTTEMTSELRSDAQQLGTTASNRVHSELDARKGNVATQAKSVSSAIDRAAGELDEGAPEWLRSAFQQGATQVRKLADTLEQKGSRQILDDVRTLARDNPGTFLAGCAALGFAAARIFKAGGSEPSLGQPPQAQFPPVAVDEPTFRSGGTGQPSSTSAGEFA